MFRNTSASETDYSALVLRHTYVWLAVFLFCLGIGSPLNVAFGDCLPAPSGLVGWWPGDGNANNMLGTNNGTLTGNVTVNTAGFVLNGFRFDGTNSYVQIADSPILRPTNLTLEAWVKFDSLDSAGSASAGQQYIVFKQNSRSDGFEGYTLGKTRIAGGDVFTFNVTSSGGQEAEVQSTSLVATGVWYHVAAVRGSNFCQMHINGVMQSQSSVAFAQDYGNFPLYFGTSGQSFWDRKFKGTLDEVSLYNRPLSSNEIAAIYSSGAFGKCKAPNITVPPLPQSVLMSSNATFSVGATGFGLLSYQWRFNGTNIAGATATNYTRANVQPADAGGYSVVITNIAGAVTSAVVNLTITIPPSITTPPQGLTVNQGQNAGFSVTVGGTAPFNYQWRFNGTNIGGATASNYTRVSAQPADVGGYSVVVTNPAGSVTSIVANLAVNIPPAISTPPQSLTVNQGQDAAFSVGATGTAPLGYQWRFNGNPIGGATASNFTRVSAQPADIGGYSVVVSNMAGSITSIVASLAVNIPPGISVPPQNLTVAQGQDAAFSVLASGTAPLSYQWQFNGTNIDGANSSIYTRSNAQPADVGGYAVVVANMAGSVTSIVANLIVNFPPAISTPPQDLTVAQGQNAAFNVTATGTAPLSYQWRFNGGDISGATVSKFTRANAQTADAGGYSVVVTNVAGSVTSIVANLTVNVPPGISAPPQDLTVNQGQNAAFSVTATGTAPLSYQWRFNGTNIGGATASDYTRVNAQAADVGGYSVVVTNVAGSITSVVANLAVNIPPGISTPPQGLTVNQGQDASFNVTATGTAPLNYQWRFNGTNIGGATASNYIRLSAQPGDIGGYSVVITNMAGSITSIVANLAVNIPPGISASPQGLTVNQGQNAAFSVTASGTAPLNFQWRFNGTNIGGATASDYTRVNAQPADIGGYSVVITNMAGSITSVVANLAVNIPPGISIPPQGLTINQGQDAAFSVTATGTAPLNYQWRFNGTNIGGATASDYTRFSAQPADIGGYAVVITNMAGSVTSIVATLAVNIPPGISTPPQALTVNQGQDAAFSVFATGTAPLNYQWRFNGTNIGGATASIYTRVSAQPADIGGYSVVITNMAGSITSIVASLAVNIPPAISIPPQGLTVNQGQDAAFSVTATGTAPLNYQWRFNGTNIGGATANTYTRVNAQSTDVGGYSVVIANMAGSITSIVANLAVNIPPGISIPPQGLTVNQGQDAAFSVTATGTAPLSYQWRFSGTNIGGATASNYTRISAQAADVGGYSVVITNVAGSVTSVVASLAVNIPPAISTPPQDLTVNQGQNAAFSVTATGTAPLSYQWRFNGTNIDGATASIYTRISAQSVDGGGYSVVVTNVAGSITSIVANLTVNGPPTITAPPADLTVNQGQDASFNVTATGTAPLVFQWRFNGTNIGAATSSLYTRTNAQAADVGGYTVVITNVAGSITSVVANLAVNLPPGITAPPQGLTVFQGQDAAFSVTATGTAPLNYQWRFNGTNILGATASNYTRVSAQVNNTGGYSVIITNMAGAITSIVANLTVNSAPTILAQPQSRTNVVGTTANFSVTAAGLQLAYQWRLSGTNLVAATNASLSLPNVQTTNGGNYTVVITNPGGSLTSAVAALTILVPPSITAQPQSRTNTPGTTANFSVTAAGTAPLKYQWSFNGVNLGGATTSSLSLASVQPGDAGNYLVVVTNGAGSVTSAVAALTVIGSFNTWYVDNTAVGSSNTGTNWANAWSNLTSIVWGFNGVKAGDTLYISGGSSSKVYTNEWVIGASGTPGHQLRIAIDAANPSHNGRVIFDFDYAGEQADATAITCLRSYVTIDGNVNGESRLIISNLRNYLNEFTALGIYAEQTSGVVIDHVAFTNVNDGIRFTSATKFTVCNSQFHQIRGDAAIQGAASLGDWDSNLIYSNYFELLFNTATPPGAPEPYYGPDGIQCGNGTSIFNNILRRTITTTKYTSKQHPDSVQAVGDSTKIYNNEFINIGDSAIDFGLYSGPVVDGVYIFNNLFRIDQVIDTFPEYIRIYNGSLTEMKNIKILNNTFVDNDNWTNIKLENFGTPTGVGNEIKNNIFYNCGGSSFRPLIYFDNGCAFAADSWTFDGNVYYRTNGETYVFFGNSYSASQWISRFEPHGRTNAPTFVNYVPNGTNNDFHLVAGDSAAVDQGLDLSSIFTVSRDMVPRPQGVAWDAGAYERPGGGYAFTNLAPVVAPITPNVADVDPSAPGLQVLRNTSVQYSSSAVDPEGNPLTWQWIYSLNGGSETVYQSGTGAVATISFNYGSATSGNTYVWGLRVSDGLKASMRFLTVNVITAARTNKALVFEAESGNLTGPFIATNGYIQQLLPTAPGEGGRATYNFTITNAGQYMIQALVDAPRFGQNSFLVNIDADPLDLFMEWEVPITLGFENHKVSWRGEGTCSQPQWPAKVFDLALGEHQLIVEAKDANVCWDQLSLIALADVITMPATSPSYGSAVLNGLVNPLGVATTVFFRFGTTTNYGSVTSSGSVGSGNITTPVALLATGLMPQTTYHFQLGATGTNGTSYGEDLTFTTMPAPGYNNGQFTYWVATDVGRVYYLEYILTLNSTNWTLAASVVGDGSPHALVDPNAMPPQRFYRVRVQ